MPRYISENHGNDRIDRRGFLDCMAWAGTGMLWSLSGGVGRSQTLDHPSHGHESGLTFVQISDSHIGFNKEANKDVSATLREAVARINALPAPPAFLIHTGDITHLSKPMEFAAADEILQTAKVGRVFAVPGEHDVLSDSGKSYLARYGKDAHEKGWFSFDHSGVHFVGLVNVLDLKAGGLGSLGREQLAWLEKDVKPLTANTPIVVFAHVPLWTVYPEWGWGTDDGLEALALLKRFGSVTVLNGHIHQTMQKVEGHMMFHTAASTAFPQPKPGTAPSPGPMKVPPDELRRFLGLTRVQYVQGREVLAVVDSTLESSPTVTIDNFSFTPNPMTIPAGTRVTWVNHDDIPHNVVSTEKLFASAVLDTDQSFSHEFDKPGIYSYFCSLHPKMTAKLVVKERATG